MVTDAAAVAADIAVVVVADIAVAVVVAAAAAAAVEDDAGAGKEYHTDVPELAVEEGPRHPRSGKATTTVLHLFKRRMIDKVRKDLARY